MDRGGDELAFPRPEGTHQSIRRGAIGALTQTGPLAERSASNLPFGRWASSSVTTSQSRQLTASSNPPRFLNLYWTARLVSVSLRSH